MERAWFKGFSSELSLQNWINLQDPREKPKFIGFLPKDGSLIIPEVRGLKIRADLLGKLSHPAWEGIRTLVRLHLLELSLEEALYMAVGQSRY